MSDSDEYVRSLAGVPLPSRPQREEFVRFVARAHSWYKHLPLCPPGIPFYVFLDKYSGCDNRMTVDADRTVVPAELATRDIHHSSMATADYRARFGHLAYSNADQPGAHMARPSLVKTGGQPVVVRTAHLWPLPAEIRDLARVTLTGVMHPSSSTMPFLWELEKARGSRDWPEESGGRATLDRIFARCRELLDPAFVRVTGQDPVLQDLLAPERERQHREMMRAIDRVCDFVEAARV